MNLPQSAYSKSESADKDRCYTPPYAVDLLVPFLPAGSRIWEPACGDGHIAYVLMDAGFDVVASDIETGIDFFTTEPTDGYDLHITNPPYQSQLKADWLERCYLLGKPFALLMPGSTLFPQGTGRLLDQYGYEMIIPDDRIDFFMPNEGYREGKAQFHSVWFTWGLDIGGHKRVRFTKPVEAEVIRRVAWLKSRYELRAPEIDHTPVLVRNGADVWQQKTIMELI